MAPKKEEVAPMSTPETPRTPEPVDQRHRDFVARILEQTDRFGQMVLNVENAANRSLTEPDLGSAIEKLNRARFPLMALRDLAREIEALIDEAETEP